MARSVLIDTSAWVQAMRRHGDEATRNEVHAALRTGRARFCDVVRLELWAGIGSDAERKWLLEMEQSVETVPTPTTLYGRRREGLLKRPAALSPTPPTQGVRPVFLAARLLLLANLEASP